MPSVAYQKSLIGRRGVVSRKAHSAAVSTSINEKHKLNGMACLTKHSKDEICEECQLRLVVTVYIYEWRNTIIIVERVNLPLELAHQGLELLKYL